MVDMGDAETVADTKHASGHACDSMLVCEYARDYLCLHWLHRLAQVSVVGPLANLSAALYGAKSDYDSSFTVTVLQGEGRPLTPTVCGLISCLGVC